MVIELGIGRISRDEKVEKPGLESVPKPKERLSKGEQAMLDFMHKKIDVATETIIQLMEDGKIPKGFITLVAMKGDPQALEVIDQICTDFDYDPDVLRIIEDQVEGSQEKKEVEKELGSLARIIVETHSHHGPRMSQDLSFPERRLQVGIKNHDLTTTISAIKDMKVSSLSVEEIERLASIASTNEYKDILFSIVDEQLSELDKKADRDAGLD